MTQVGVLIAAKDAAATIGRAVASALAQEATSEVIVVDDGSGDETVASALRHDDGTGRLRADRMPGNFGPSAARNRAIEMSGAEILCVLDADDYLLPGRLATMLAEAGANWDLAADGLIMVQPDDPITRGRLHDFRAQVGQESLSVESFVYGNISVTHRPRHELGFMKPLIRRGFLDRSGLRFNEHLRLGEDFALYAEALLRGARFVLTPSVGYVAMWRKDSLSGRHSAKDLFNLARASLGLADLAEITPSQRSALLLHARSVTLKAKYQMALEIKQHGRLSALARFLSSNLLSVPYMLRETARAKLR
jgi:succinoglycan biosynthesis protein ExoU